MATLANLVRTYITSTGTGTLSLGGAVPGFLTPAQAGLANGSVVSYSIIDGVNTEVGRGTYNSTLGTVTRGPLYSTNNNAAINVTSVAEFAITFLNDDKLDLETATNNRILNAAGVITNTHLASVPSGTVKGRVASGTGVPTDLTAAQLRTLIGMSVVNNTGNPQYTRIVLGGAIILGGSAIVNTNGSGEAQVNYPVAFPSGQVFVTFLNGDPGAAIANAVLSQRLDSLGLTSAFIFRAFVPGAGTVNNQTVRINYVAVGPLT